MAQAALIEYEKPDFILRFVPTTPILVAVRGLPRRRYHPTPIPHWVVPAHADNLLPLRQLMSEHGFTMTDTAKKVLTRMGRENRAASRPRVSLASERNTDAPEPTWTPSSPIAAAPVPYPPTDGSLHPALRPFQRTGVEYFLRVKRAINADDMGLGKSFTALAAVDAAGAYPCIVICNKLLRINWMNECRRWFPERSVAVLHATKHTRGDLAADICILHYDIAAARVKSGILDEVERRRFRSIILDEAHLIKETKTKRTQAVLELSAEMEYRFALTGTPVLNRPLELAAQLECIDQLHPAFGGFYAFVDRYCDAKTQTIKGKEIWDFTGASNLDELHEKLHSTCMIRRLKNDVLPELPAKIRNVVKLELSNRTEYDDAVRDFLHWLEDNARHDQAFFARIAHLALAEQSRQRELYVRDTMHKARRAEQLVRIAALRQLVATGKFAQIKAWLRSKLDSGAKLVVFAIHHEMQRALQSAFPSALHLFADDKLPDQQASIEAFQTESDHRLLLCSLSTAGVGITLTAAHHVVMTELGWNPGIMDQAEDRVHRIGQSNTVQAWYLLAEHTIDEHLSELLDNKREIASVITDGTIPDESLLDELTSRLSQNKLIFALPDRTNRNPSAPTQVAGIACPDTTTYQSAPLLDLPF